MIEFDQISQIEQKANAIFKIASGETDYPITIAHPVVGNGGVECLKLSACPENIDRLKKRIEELSALRNNLWNSVFVLFSK